MEGSLGWVWDVEEKGGGFGCGSGRERGRGKTYTEPADDVAVGWAAGTAGELLIADCVYDDGVVEGSCWGEGGIG